MNPIYIAWALSGVGAVAFFVLGYTCAGWKKRQPTAEEKKRAAQSQDRIKSLERMLAVEKVRREEAEQAIADVETSKASLKRSLEKETQNQELQKRDALTDAGARVTALKMELKEAQKAQKEAKLRLDAAHLTMDEMRAEIEGNDQKHEAHRREHKALIEKHQKLEEDLRIIESVQSQSKRPGHDLLLGQTVKSFLERPWPQAEHDSNEDELNFAPAGSLWTQAAEKAEADERKKVTSDKTSQNEEEQEEHDRTSLTPLPEVAGVLGKLEGSNGVSAVALANTQGLPISGELGPNFYDSITGYLGMLSQLAFHAHDFLPIGDISSCELRDRKGKVFSCWIFPVLNDHFALGLMSSDKVQIQKLVRPTIDDLTHLLESARS